VKSQIYFGMKLYAFRKVPLSHHQEFFTVYSSGICHRGQAGSGWNILILSASCQKACMTYIIAVCTVKHSWWWTEELSETCRVSFQNKFEMLVNLVGFIIRNLSRCTATWT